VKLSPGRIRCDSWGCWLERTLRALRVLLVEDTEDVAEAIVANFSRSGHAVDRVTGCGAARDAVAVQDYDLVILDINLPDGSGFDFLKAMRGARNGRRSWW